MTGALKLEKHIHTHTHINTQTYANLPVRAGEEKNYSQVYKNMQVCLPRISHTKGSSCLIWISHVTYAWVMSYIIFIMSNITESCHVWMSHVTCEWAISRMHKSCRIRMSDLIYGPHVSSHTWMSMPCQLWMSFTLYQSVTSPMKLYHGIYTCMYVYTYTHTQTHTLYINVCVYIYIYICICIYVYVYTYIYMYILTHTHTRTYEVVSWRCYNMCLIFASRKELYRTICSGMSHVTLIWVMWHMNESCHIWMSHVTYEWVMSRMNESCHIWLSQVTHEWVTSPVKIYYGDATIYISSLLPGTCTICSRMSHITHMNEWMNE